MCNSTYPHVIYIVLYGSTRSHTFFSICIYSYSFSPIPLLSLCNEPERTISSSAVIKSHILPNVICSAAVQGKARTVNLLDGYLMLEKTEDNEIFVGDAEVLERDVVGTNGVLHVVSGPLMPQEGEHFLRFVSSSRNFSVSRCRICIHIGIMMIFHCKKKYLAAKVLLEVQILIIFFPDHNTRKRKKKFSQYFFISNPIYDDFNDRKKV